jgi:hypothetical protein
MELTAKSCATRRSLERRNWLLTHKLSLTATRLMGSDHKRFNETAAKCSEIRSELAGVHKRLQDHRSDHGC